MHLHFWDMARGRLYASVRWGPKSESVQARRRSGHIRNSIGTSSFTFGTRPALNRAEWGAKSAWQAGCFSEADGRRTAEQSRGERVVGLSLVFRRLCWWLSLLGAGLVQCWADVTPLSITPINGSSSGLSVNLAWTPSPSTNVTGYFLNWGLASGQCTNQLDVGNVTNTTVAGLTTGVTYYFNVVAYDAAGDQAPPSNELAYPPPPPTISLQLQRNGTNAPLMSVRFLGTAGNNYTIQATTDFKQWVTIGTTNCSVDGLIAYMTADPAIYPSRFYRVLRQ
jgi:Fibronectin type III domain